MPTNQRSILQQRAVRAENAQRVAATAMNVLRAEVQELRDALRKYRYADALAASLNPVTRSPHAGDTVQLVLVRDAQFTEAGYHCPYTGEQFTPTKNTYWRKLEDPS